MFFLHFANCASLGICREQSEKHCSGCSISYNKHKLGDGYRRMSNSIYYNFCMDLEVRKSSYSLRLNHLISLFFLFLLFFCFIFVQLLITLGAIKVKSVVCKWPWTSLKVELTWVGSCMKTDPSVTPFLLIPVQCIVILHPVTLNIVEW